MTTKRKFTRAQQRAAALAAIDRPNPPPTAPAPGTETVKIGSETFDTSDPLSALALLTRVCDTVSMNGEGHRAVQRSIDTLKALTLEHLRCVGRSSQSDLSLRSSKPDSAAPDPKSDHPRPGPGSN